MRSSAAVIVVLLTLAAAQVLQGGDAQTVRTYVLIVGPPEGGDVLYRSMEAFSQLRTWGAGVRPLRFFEGIGPGGVFQATPATAAMVEEKLHPYLLLESEVVKLASGSATASQEVGGFSYFPGGEASGRGVKVAVVDTGVDYTHPAFGGRFGLKVVGGYDFVDDDGDPMDVDGHGTAVAGILAGNSSDFQGMAPGAQLLVYRIFVNDQTTTDLIVRALDRARSDGAQIVNLSLGGGLSSSSLNKMGYLLYTQGIRLVAAAGNEGPDLETVQSPASLPYFLSVGASLTEYSTEPMAEVRSSDGRPFSSALPMSGTPLSDGVITGPTKFIMNGAAAQVKGMDLTGFIAVSLRDHKTLFAEMEYNAANSGAKALIVVNDETVSLSSVKLEWTGNPSYRPRIPVVTLSGAEGASLAKSASDGTVISLAVSNVDGHFFPASFSSRGPVDDFSVKPDLLAPGDNVLAPESGTQGYARVSGSSFSAPQVSGLLALLLELRPTLTVEQSYSMVVMGATPASGLLGELPLEGQGAGVVNVTKTLSAPFALDRRDLLLYPGLGHPYSGELTLFPLSSSVSVSFSSYGGHPLVVTPSALTLSSASSVTVTAVGAATEGERQGRLVLTTSGSSYTLPVRVLASRYWLGYDPAKGQVYASLSSWGHATVTVTRPDGTVYQDSWPSGSNYTLVQTVPGEYRISVTFSGTEPSVARLMVILEASQVGQSGMAHVPPYVPVGVIFFSAFVVVAALLLYAAESRLVRTAI
jgi:minor extracellular serine protease Vpr